ncbi:hypothetical protein [Sphingomonas xinjiangensis]|uniref:Uncharacterized protein n=1 Tax=Sphingomonas xinjiangensis TaxID=643568 RepID=A0A840YHY1_9SPHN|nr:hypothetical protein [Sphingomonas xinjiangensis]MBB5712005.1 hypothetical protein [Sphingomonas xinjiangensis]
MLIAALLSLAVQDRLSVFPGGDEAIPPVLPKRSCQPKPGEDVVVCGNADPDRFRARLVEDGRYREKPLRPEFNIAGVGKADVQAVQRTFPGASAPGMMFSLKIPLGNRKDDE